MKPDYKFLEHINEIAKIDLDDAKHMLDLYIKGMSGDTTASAEYVTSGLSGSASASSDDSSCGCSTVHADDTCGATSITPDSKIVDLHVELDTLKSDVRVFERKLYSDANRIDHLEDRLSEITDITRALVLLKKDSLESTAALMTVLEGYLDEDIVNEKDIIEKLYERIKEIKKTPMFKEMKHRIAEYKEDRDEH